MMLSVLNSSYDPVVTVLTTTAANLQLDDFYSSLLSFEMRLEIQYVNFPQPTAHMAHRTNTKSSTHSQTNNANRGHNQSNGNRNPPLEDLSIDPMFTERLPVLAKSVAITITLRSCWYHFNKDYTLSSTYDHPHVAYVVALGLLLDDNWCPDSGATHHLTSNLNNLQIRNQYDSSDRIKVGNGNTLSISHVGNSSFCFNIRDFYSRTMSIMCLIY